MPLSAVTVVTASPSPLARKLPEIGQSDARNVLSSSSVFFVPFAMSIDHAAVLHIARLARLAVDDAQLPALASELGRVLELADRLGAADIEGVEPLAHPHDQTLAWRPDAVSEVDRADALLALAPEARGGLYLVPKVIE